MMIDISLDLDKPGWMAHLDTEALRYELIPLKKDKLCQGYGCLHKVNNKNDLIALYSSKEGLYFYCLGKLIRLDQPNLKCSLKHGFFKSKFELFLNDEESIKVSYQRTAFGSEVLDDVYELITDNNNSGKRIEKLIKVLSETDKEKRFELDCLLNDVKK